MIELENLTSHNIDLDFLNTVADLMTDKEIELIITTNANIQKINAVHRNIDKATDVLSFPYEDMPMVPLGSIVISMEFVEKVASELSHSKDDELSLLFIHGLLHLLGYDHEVDSGEMREEEARLIREFNLPKSLIIRTEG